MKRMRCEGTHKSFPPNDEGGGPSIRETEIVECELPLFKVISQKLNHGPGPNKASALFMPALQLFLQFLLSLA